MKKKNKKSLLLLGILLLIFIFTFVRALKPVKTTTTVISESGSEEILNGGNEASSSSKELFDFKEFDRVVNRVQTLVKNIEQQQGESFRLSISRDPFSHPDTRYTDSKIETSSSKATASEIIVAPDFRVSGIVYDSEEPMVVIDDEVKAENETKSGYTISKILPDRVFLKYRDKTFVLYVDSENIVEKQPFQISDADDVSDTLVFSSVRKNYRSILKDSDGIAAGSSTAVRNSQPAISTLNIRGSYSDNRTNERIMTIQVASFDMNREKNAIELARKIISDGFVDVRVEKINGMYAIRVGRAAAIDDLTDLCGQLKKYSDSSFVRKAFYMENRIVFPQQDSG